MEYSTGSYSVTNSVVARVVTDVVLQGTFHEQAATLKPWGEGEAPAELDYDHPEPPPEP